MSFSLALKAKKKKLQSRLLFFCCPKAFESNIHSTIIVIYVNICILFLLRNDNKIKKLFLFIIIDFLLKISRIKMNDTSFEIKYFKWIAFLYKITQPFTR